MHKRLSVHSVTFLGMPLAEQQSVWRALGLDAAQPDRLPTRANPDWRNSSSRTGTRSTPSTTCSNPARACPVSSRAPPRVGTRVVYMLTGGRREFELGAGGRTFLRGDRPVRARGAAGRRGIGDRERLRPLCRHPLRPHPAGHDHAGGDGGSRRLHRPVSLLGRGRPRRPRRTRVAADPVRSN